MADHGQSLVSVVGINPLMGSDHTNPYSNITPLDLREYRVIQIPYGYSRLESQLMTPMVAIAHERQFVTAQLDYGNHHFEAQHTRAIAQFLADQDRVLEQSTSAAREMDFSLRYITPMGTENLPTFLSQTLEIDGTPPSSPVISIKLEPEPHRVKSKASSSLATPPTGPGISPHPHLDIEADSQSSGENLASMTLTKLLRDSMLERKPRGSRVKNQPRIRTRSQELKQEGARGVPVSQKERSRKSRPNCKGGGQTSTPTAAAIAGGARKRRWSIDDDDAGRDVDEGLADQIAPSYARETHNQQKRVRLESENDSEVFDSEYEEDGVDEWANGMETRRIKAR